MGSAHLRPVGMWMEKAPAGVGSAPAFVTVPVAVVGVAGRADIVVGETREVASGRSTGMADAARPRCGRQASRKRKCPVPVGDRTSTVDDDASVVAAPTAAAEEDIQWWRASGFEDQGTVQHLGVSCTIVLGHNNRTYGMEPQAGYLMNVLVSIASSRQ